MAMNARYPFSAYDDNLCLRPGLALWAVLAFLLRPYVVVVVSLANRVDRMRVIDTFYPDRASMAISALLALPALLLVWAWIKRQRGQGGLAQRVWRHGRALLLGLASLNACAIVVAAVHAGTRPGLAAVAQLAACALIVWYLMRSERVCDTFLDYPKVRAQSAP